MLRQRKTLVNLRKIKSKVIDILVKRVFSENSKNLPGAYATEVGLWAQTLN